MVSPVITHFLVATVGINFLPQVATNGPPLTTTKCVMATAVATGGAAMGSAVATGGLPWVVSTGSLLRCKSFRKAFSQEITLESQTLETVDKTRKQSLFNTLVAETLICTDAKPWLHAIDNKPGTAQVGAISKAQKDSKTTFSTTGDNKSSQKTKN